MQANISRLIYALGMDAKVVSVSRSPGHGFSKERVDEIVVLAGLGIEGDAHAGEKVKHRYLVKKNPEAPNLCQVHLLQSELLTELKDAALEIAPGDMGENVTTEGLSLIDLPTGARLHLGAQAVVELTGLRTPCVQMDAFKAGLKQACFGRDAAGKPFRKAGVMGIALVGGVVKAGDEIGVELPLGEWVKLKPV